MVSRELVARIHSSTSPMCWFLVLITRTDCDLAALRDVAARHGFAPCEATGDAVVRLPGYCTMWPYDVHCDCGTEVGSAHRNQRDAARLRRLARKGRRKRWSQARRESWIRQQLDADKRGEATPHGRSAELERWCAFARDAGSTPEVGVIGLLKHWAGDRLPEDTAPDRTAATPETLLHLEPGRPTLLIPA